MGIFTFLLIMVSVLAVFGVGLYLSETKPGMKVLDKLNLF